MDDASDNSDLKGVEMLKGVCFLACCVVVVVKGTSRTV